MTKSGLTVAKKGRGKRKWEGSVHFQHQGYDFRASDRGGIE